jgi:hypothetical protein
MPPFDEQQDDYGSGLNQSPVNPTMPQLAELAQMGDLSLSPEQGAELENYYASQQAPEPLMPDETFVNSPGVQSALAMNSIQDAMAYQEQIAKVKAMGAEQIRQQIEGLTKNQEMDESQIIATAFSTLLPILAGAAIRGKEGAFMGMEAGGRAGLTYTKGIEAQRETEREDLKERLKRAEDESDKAQATAITTRMKQLERDEKLQDDKNLIDYRAEAEGRTNKGKPVALDEGQKIQAKEDALSRSKSISKASNNRKVLVQLHELAAKHGISEDVDLVDGFKQAFGGKVPSSAQALITAVLNQDLLDNLKTTQVGAPSNLDTAMQKVARGNTFGASLGSIMRVIQTDTIKANENIRQVNERLASMGQKRMDDYYNPNYKQKWEKFEISNSDKEAIGEKLFPKAKEVNFAPLEIPSTKYGKLKIKFSPEGEIEYIVPVFNY